MFKNIACILLPAAIILSLLLQSCADNAITVGANRDMFIARSSAMRQAQSDSINPVLPESFSPGQMNMLPGYRLPPKPDRLSEFLKALIRSSGCPAVFINAKTMYRRGETVTLAVGGKPFTEYDLGIKYKSGYSSARGIGFTVSDGRGYAVWTFKIGNVSDDPDFIPQFEVSWGNGKIIRSFQIESNREITPYDEPLKNESFTEDPPCQESQSSAPKASRSVLPLETETETTAESSADPASNSGFGLTQTIQPDDDWPVVFLNAKDEYLPGETVSLSALGRPDMTYTLKLRYKSGYSTAKGLGESKADNTGYVLWTFKISANADPEFEPFFEIVSGDVKATARFKLAQKKGIDASDNGITDIHGMPESMPESETTAEETPGLAENQSIAETTAIENSNIKFVDAKESYKRGENVIITIMGLPDTLYILKVRYKSGYSKAGGLGESASDGSGTVSWSFRIGNRTDTSFISWFEITGAGETALHYFNITS